MFNKQETNILNQIETLKESLDLIHFKQWYYSTAKYHNSEKFVKNMSLDDMPEDIQKLYKKTHLYEEKNNRQD